MSLPSLPKNHDISNTRIWKRDFRQSHPFVSRCWIATRSSWLATLIRRSLRWPVSILNWYACSVWRCIQMFPFPHEPWKNPWLVGWFIEPVSWWWKRPWAPGLGICVSTWRLMNLYIYIYIVGWTKSWSGKSQTRYFTRATGSELHLCFPMDPG